MHKVMKSGSKRRKELTAVSPGNVPQSPRTIFYIQINTFTLSHVSMLVLLGAPWPLCWCCVNSNPLSFCLCKKTTHWHRRPRLKTGSDLIYVTVQTLLYLSVTLVFQDVSLDSHSSRFNTFSGTTYYGEVHTFFFVMNRLMKWKWEKLATTSCPW